MEQPPIIEITALKWASVMSGWKRRYICLYKDSLSIVKSKVDRKRKNNVISIPLSKLAVVHEEKKANHFSILYDKKKIYFKVEKEEEALKQIFFDKLYQAINDNKNAVNTLSSPEHLSSRHTTTFSNAVTSSMILTPKSDDNSDMCASSVVSAGQDEVVEMNKKQFVLIEQYLDMINKHMLYMQIMEKGVKRSFRTSFNEIVSGIILSTANMKKNLETVATTTTSVTVTVPHSTTTTTAAMVNNEINLEQVPTTQCLVKQDKKNVTTPTPPTVNDNDNENDDDDDDSIIDQLDDSSSEDDEEHLIVDDMKSVCQIITESKKSLKSFKRGLSQQISDFYDSRYDFPPRTSLPCVLKFSESFLKDSIKAATSKKSSFPLHYNEPISMLQKQCEKFFYIDYLTKAASPDITNEQRLLYIIAFFCGELSQNINRYLKPMNPVLGETFEYFDNNKKYRFFSEQVSHFPPISAYVCESNDFVYYGDTRCKTAFKLLKGAMELHFNNKTYIYFKHIDEKFIFNRPKIYLNGLMSGLPRYDCEGKMIIQSVKDKALRAELHFNEDKISHKKHDVLQRDIILMEGNVIKGNDIVYKVNGNWKEVMFYMDKDGKNRKEMWNVVKEEYMTNSYDKYCLPSYSLNFNYIDDNLKAILPITDTRKRPDQREYENGNLNKAVEIRKGIEKKQRKRHDYFDDNKITYEPVYFKNVYDETGDDYVYVYKGGYFEERVKGSCFANAIDIFGLND